MPAEASLLTFNGTVIVEGVIFVIVAFLMYRLAWGPLVTAIDARNAKIQQGLEAAQRAERSAQDAARQVHEELEEARTQAREILSRAHAEATADAEETRGRSRREAESIVERARADIGVERDRALAELRTQVGTLVVEATGKVLGQAIDARAHQRLIEESIAEVSTN